MAKSVRETFRVGSDPDLRGIDPRGRPTGPRDKTAAADAMTDLAPRLAGLQDRLYAGATAGDPRAVLLVLQGMDTSGKGGVISHVAGLVNPQGLRIASFKKPTPEERAHHFLWRIGRQVPAAGQLGVFDRSHYEDVLIARVAELVPEDVWQGRYEEINAFEAELHDSGVTILKCMLHISPAEQTERLLARLDDPQKHWKYNPPTSTRGRSGPPTSAPMPTRSRAATPITRPGTWSRRTASGTATGPSPRCSRRRWRSSTRATPPPESTSRPRRHACGPA